MAQFFQIKAYKDRVCYVNREMITAIIVMEKPDGDGDYVVSYGLLGNGEESVICSYFETLEEAKAEARKIAEGRGAIIPSEAD